MESDARYKIYSAETSHARLLSNIHASVFQSGWSENEFLKYISSPTHTVSVIEETRQPNIAGFVVFSVVPDQAEVLTFCIDKSCQNRGLGKKLFLAGLEELKGMCVCEVFLEVREDNIAGRKLYENLGFKLVGIRKGYYKCGTSAGNVDGLVMQMSI